MLSTKSPWGVNCSFQKLGHTAHGPGSEQSVKCWLTANLWVWEKENPSFSFPSLIGVQHSLPVSDLDEAVMVFAASSVLFEGTTVQSYSKQMPDCSTFLFSLFLTKPLWTSVAWRLDWHWDSNRRLSETLLAGQSNHSCAQAAPLHFFYPINWTFCLKDSYFTSNI